MTIEQIVDDLARCHKAGAGGAHIHIRDADGNHLLDAGLYRETLDAVAAKVPTLALQITTEAVGRYEPEEQMRVALRSGANMVSVSTREIARADHALARRFFDICADQGIAVQHILYDVGDCEKLAAILPREALHDPNLQLLFVLGRHNPRLNSDPSELLGFLRWRDALGLTPDWAACAFGANETRCMLTTAAQGGKCRIGFENSLYLMDGTIARDNAEKVRDLAERLTVMNYGTIDQTA